MSSDAAIPGPPGHWLIGNLSDIDVENTMESLCSLTQTYGGCFLALHEAALAASMRKESCRDRG